MHATVLYNYETAMKMGRGHDVETLVEQMITMPPVSCAYTPDLLYTEVSKRPQ